jgi:hypothetical protein
MRIITNTYRGPEVMAFFVNGSAGASVVLRGPDLLLATLVRNGVGDYTITLGETAAKILYALAPLSQAADKIAYTAVGSTTAIQILTRTVGATPAASDCDFSIMLLVNRTGANYRQPGAAT